MKKLILILVLLSFTLTAQSPYGNEPFAHTYSIVARDAETGEMGVAVQSNWFSVGTIVTWAEAGVGAIATQSFVNPAFGPDGLKLLKEGKTADEALDILIASDESREVRQLAIIDNNGNTAVFTGEKCVQYAGHIEGNGFTVQANLMASPDVWPAMKKSYLENAGLPLAERMLAALEAAQDAGGDVRGKQSAAILVVAPKSSGKIWQDRLVDLRIEDHPEPLKEIKRVLKVHRAYEHMNRGDLAVEHGDMQLAMEEYSAAEKMFPENLEMKFWRAVTLANNGRLEESLPLFKEIFVKNMNWHALIPRLIKPGLLTVSEEELQKILNVVE
ncbi:MAG: DUF1028 domain-containing protein [Melioribacteraceae bacterium]|nr:DUF1028 domain-containing protein [Melioribacteraceae bacterium]